VRTAASSFWSHLDGLVSRCELVIDRPAGSRHPRYPELQYPLDYGYLQGSQAGDGAEMDCWVGSLPEHTVTGVVVTVDLLKRDAEVKALLGCTAEEMETISAFHNCGPMGAVVVVRPAGRYRPKS
jgi:inorganic pyrophosphatase